MLTRKTNADEEKRKESCRELLALDRQKLLMRQPFIGGIIMRMDTIPVRDDRLETACTDGDNIYVDIDFYGKLSADERLFILAHEVWHAVLLHFARKQNRDTQLFNAACDLEIHFTLAEEKMKEPWVLPHDPRWKQLSAEEIYEKLLDDPRYQKPEEHAFDKHIYQGEKGPGGSPLQDAGEEAGEENSDEEDGGRNSEDRESEKGEAQNGGENAIVLDDDFAPSATEETAERVRGRAIASAQQLERQQGTLPGSAAKLIRQLQKPSLPWQEMLKQFVTSCYGEKRRWLPPSRRHVWQSLYLPSIRTESIRAAVALDTSGSTTDELDLFLGELLSLMKSFGRFELTVIQCDADIQSVAKYDQDRIPSSKDFSFKGFGGTDFRPVFDYVAKEMKEKPDLLLYFTDGYGPAPDKAPPYPVMWLLTKEGKVPCSWGRHTYFKEK